MLTKRMILLSLILLPNFLFSQQNFFEYNRLINEAELLYREDQFKEALDTYLIAFHYDNNFYDIFRAAACAFQLEKEELAEKLLRRAIKEDGAVMEDLRSFEDLKEYQDRDSWQKIEEAYPTLRQAYFTAIENLDLYIEFEKMVEKDQALRGFRFGHPIADSLRWQKMAEIDSLNMVRLMEITAEHGWQRQGWLFLWHQRSSYGKDNKIWRYFTPIINEAIASGRERPDFWAMFEDFKSMEETGQQIYGTLPKFKLVDGKMVKTIEAIVDPQKVDQLRAGIGLCSLKDFCLRNDIVPPEEYIALAKDH